MAAFFARRLLQLIGLLIVVSALIFFVLRLGPFQPGSFLADAGSDPARIAQIKADWHLDQPLPVQYVNYMADVVRGDFGRSFTDNQPVSTTVSNRLPATVELAVASMLIGTLLGLGLGIVSALWRGKASDTAGRAVALAGTSMPSFWLGVMAIALFAVRFGWLPAGGRVDSSAIVPRHTGFLVLDGVLSGRADIVWMALRHLVMPSLVLGFFVAGYIARITRTTMVEALSQDYIRTGLAKGASRRRLVLRHALPNTALPVVTVLGLQFGLLLSGAAVTETVFSYPGMGKLLVDAIRGSDFPQVQASILILAGTYCIVNAAVDVLYAAIDPRIRAN
jgi:peptide/nickel transport system permease protein